MQKKSPVALIGAQPWGGQGFCLRVGWGNYATPRSACAKLAPVVRICVGSDIISGRESGARNLGCAGNNRLGRCPYSERRLAS
jgi:hypothetical protein